MIYPQKDFKDFYYRRFGHRPSVEFQGFSFLTGNGLVCSWIAIFKLGKFWQGRSVSTGEKSACTSLSINAKMQF